MRRQKKIQINFLEIFDIFERFFFKNKNELIAFMGRHSRPILQRIGMQSLVRYGADVTLLSTVAT